jgi:hypothetical protein
MLQFLVDHSLELDALARLVVFLGVPAGLIQFGLKVSRERYDRDYGTYDALDDKYIEFQRLCMEYPRLDVFDIQDKEPATLDPLQKKQELIAFTLLFSIFERAYLMHKDRSRKVKEKQWKGWEDYLLAYCQRANFRQAWDISGQTFDEDFQNNMKNNWLNNKRSAA